MPALKVWFPMTDEPRVTSPTTRSITAGPHPKLKNVLGIALSGGGTRAALFSLGALLAVAEYSRSTNRELEISAVSGSSLAVMEVAASREDCDINAVKLAIARVTLKGYWPRKRLFVKGGALILAIATIILSRGPGSFADSPRAVAITFLEVSAFAAVITVLVFALMRSQPLFLRGYRFLNQENPSQFCSQGILRLPAGDFAATRPGRQITLDAIKINVTNVYRRARVTFATVDFFSSKEPPFIYAAASAAHPGAFISQTLPGYGDELFADGGVADNTGLDYFRASHLKNATYLCVDARPPKKRIDGTRKKLPRPVYGKNSAGLVLADALLGTLLLGLTLALAWDSYDTLSEFFTGTAIAAFLVSIITALMSSGNFSVARLIVGFISEIRWVAAAWGITLDEATEMRQAEFLDECQRAGATFSAVNILSNSCSACINMSEGKRMPTTLGRLPVDVAVHLLRHAYQDTCKQLGIGSSPNSLDFIARLEKP